MQFTKKLREPIKKGEITCSVRFWKSPRVKERHRYQLEEGAVVVTKIRQIEFCDITPQLARKSGFLNVLDLLKVAKHGQGQNIYLIDFHYEPQMFNGL